MSRKIDIAAVQTVLGTFYPPPHDEPCLSRERKRLGDAAGLTQFGVNLLRLPPGAWSSQRHWHARGDEFIYVLLGEVTLVSDAGVELLSAGDAAGFRAGEPDGHCLRNLSPHDAVVLEVGTRIKNDDVTYSDIDMLAPASARPAPYVRKDGTAYPDLKRRGRKAP
jgi:uncharacterized cupin superfamily protein